MESRSAADRSDERRRAAAAATALALALLLATFGVGIAAGSGAGAEPIGPEPTAAQPTAADPAAQPILIDPAAAPQTDGPPVGEAYQQAVDPDSVRLTVRVADDGSARWRIEYWTELDDDNETEAFEQLRDDVRANPDEYAARFANRMNGTVASAENATGREMSAGGFGVDAETRSIPREYGVLTYAFEWRGFAAVDGDRLRIGDAIDRFYLNDRTRLVVEWPDAYALVSASPDPDERRDRAVLWRGTQTDFVSGEPRVVVDAGEDGTAGGDGSDGSSEGADGGSSLLWAGGALAVLALAGGGAALLRRDGSEDAEAAASSGAAAAPGATTTGGDAEIRDAETRDAEASDAEPGDSETRDAEPSDGAEDADADGGPPPELLSNEERVRRALAANGGRMRQQELVAETGWTEAKTSQVVGEMREDGALETFRLGRENVLKLPDEDAAEQSSASPDSTEPRRDPDESST